MIDYLYLSFVINEDILGPDISNFGFLGSHAPFGLTEGVQQVPELLFLELSFAAPAVVDFLGEEVGVLFELKLYYFACTFRVPADPHNP